MWLEALSRRGLVCPIDLTAAVRNERIMRMKQFSTPAVKSAESSQTK
jgi:hypothetical protein